jgi:hypothetical protein
VYDDAWVFGNAWIWGDAEVYGNAQVFGDARISWHMEIKDNSIVDGTGSVNEESTSIETLEEKVRLVQDKLRIPSTEGFDKMLNEGKEPLNVGGVLIYPSEVLKAANPFIYDLKFREYLEESGECIYVGGDYYKRKDLVELFEALKE